jgi:hypothetical protein
VFLDAFIGLTFVELRSLYQFWTLLILQTAWCLFRNTGLFAFVYLQVKNCVIRNGKPVDDPEQLLKRDQFFMLLNIQSVLSDVLCCIAIPLMMVIDAKLPFNSCSISCVFDKQQLTDFVKRYAILLAFRICAAAVSILAYCLRYTAMVRGGWRNITRSSLWAVSKSISVAFHLHVWRNLFLFLVVGIYLFFFVPYPVITLHGFGSSSSSSSSS